MRQSTKRLGTESSATRAALIGAADQLIREEGYGAVTARRVAEKAGLKHQLIYYYFDTLGDLCLEVFRRVSERILSKLEAALDSDQPLRALWAHNSEPGSFNFQIEFAAMGTHHEAIRTALAAFGEEVRAAEEKAIARYLDARGVDVGMPPKVLTTLISGISRHLLVEHSIGMSFAHAETEAFMEAWLSRIEAAGEPSAVDRSVSFVGAAFRRP